METKINFSEKYESIIKELAQELAFNYFSVSFGTEIRERQGNEDSLIKELFTESFLKDRQPLYQRCRNVMVIGAGASYDSYKVLPLGKEMLGILNKDLKVDSLRKDNDDINRKFKSGEDRIKLKHSEADQEKAIDFENYLHLLCDFFPEQTIRKKIQEYYNFRYNPSLFYEIVAHLFKHGFIDIIINFNFDELLDQAIDEELGNSNYFSIVTDGQCKELSDIIIGGRLKIPVYIKPHGTASQKSTLRFTKDQYLDMPDEIEKLITDLISGDVQNPSEKLDRVNLICVGYNMQSLEFNRILKGYLPKDSKIYHISYDRMPMSGIEQIDMKAYNSQKSYDEDIENKVKNASKEDESYLNKRFISTKDNKSNEDFIPPLGETFRLIWKEIRDMFKLEYLKPRGIARHELITYLFYDNKYSKKEESDVDSKDREELKKKFNSSSYFQDRVIIETAIGILRGNGFIEVKEAISERMGMYYEQYKKTCEIEVGLSNREKYTLSDFLKNFNLAEDYSFASNLLNFIPLTRKEIQEDINKNIKNPKKNETRIKLKQDTLLKFGKFISEESHLENIGHIKAKENLESILKDVKRTNLIYSVMYCIINSDLISDKFLEFFLKNIDVKIDERENPKPFLFKIFEMMAKLNQSSYYDIMSRYDDRKLYIFDSFSRDILLHTDLALKYKYRTLIQKPSNWDVLFIVSETSKPINIFKSDNLKKIFENSINPKKIFTICCYESLIAEHGNENLKIKNIINKHKEKLLKYLPKNVELTVLCLPYWQHAHHMAVFLKKIPDNWEDDHPSYPPISQKSEKNFFYRYTGSIYFYKEGFSNSINPLYLSSKENLREQIENDQQMLIDTFYALIRKALYFEYTFENKEVSAIEVTKLRKEDVSSFKNDVMSFMYNTYNEKNIDDVINNEKKKLKILKK